MKIPNRFTGGTVYEAEAETMRDLVVAAVKDGVSLEGASLGAADLQGVDLRGASLQDVALQWSNLQGASLQGANLRKADLQGAALQGASLRDANLRKADLQLANLRGASLRDAALQGAGLQGVNLEAAYMRGAYLAHTCIIDIGQRSDGYQFYLHCGLGDPHILAGCRYFTIADARKHWRNTRRGTPLGEESLRMVADGLARAKIRGLI